MRTTGDVNSVAGLRHHDHACWAFSDAAEWHARAVEFLADGIDQGQQIRYIGNGGRDDLADQLAPLGDVEAMVADGRLLLTSVDDAYTDDVIDPEEQVAVFAGVAASGVAAGFTGVRVAADVSPLAADPTRLSEYARYEHLVDRLIATAPLTGLCGFDRAVVDADAIERLGCLHAVGPEAPFRLFTEGTELVLTGEVDRWVADVFAWAVERSSSGEELEIDATAATFIDHNALLVLNDYAGLAGRDVVLRTGSGVLTRVAEMIGVRSVRVELVP